MRMNIDFSPRNVTTFFAGNHCFHAAAGADHIPFIPHYKLIGFLAQSRGTFSPPSCSTHPQTEYPRIKLLPLSPINSCLNFLRCKFYSWGDEMSSVGCKGGVHIPPNYAPKQIPHSHTETPSCFLALCGVLSSLLTTPWKYDRLKSLGLLIFWNHTQKNKKRKKTDFRKMRALKLNWRLVIFL